MYRRCTAGVPPVLWWPRPENSKKTTPADRGPTNIEIPYLGVHPTSHRKGKEADRETKREEPRENKMRPLSGGLGWRRPRAAWAAREVIAQYSTLISVAFARRRFAAGNSVV